jgi:molybdate transport system permease protein
MVTMSSNESQPPASDAPRRTARLPVFRGIFVVIIIIYVVLIGGILVADLVYVTGSEAGHREIRELFFTSIPSDAELAQLPEDRQLYYGRLSYRRRAMAHSIWLSVWTSTLASAIALVIAVPAGYVLSRGRFHGVHLLDALVDIPIILPPLLFGISLLVLFQRTGLGPLLESMGIKFVFEPAGIVLVQVLISTAYGTRMLKGTFDSVDPRLAAVAETLGCSPARAFFTVTLSSARSGVVAALVMIWARALALYGPIIAFAGSTSMDTEVMPTRMYLEMSIGRLEAALLVALLMIAMATVVLVVLKLVTARGTDHVGRMMRL